MWGGEGGSNPQRACPSVPSGGGDGGERSNECISGVVECAHEDISCVVELKEHEHVPRGLCKWDTLCSQRNVTNVDQCE
jgi:hypothetical protein